MKEHVPTTTKREASLAIIGLGNIGSQLVPLLAFHPYLKRVLLVDKDHYTSANLATQRIMRSDIGQAKAAVQARQLRALNPTLEVHAIVDDVANIPLGRLRSDLIIACVDSLDARIKINQIAWRLGVCWLDGGVEPREHLVRVEGFAPQPQHPCFECALTDADYRSLGSRQPCQTAVSQTAPTNGPASLGALAAALLAEECDKLLRGETETALLGRQLILGTAHHAHLLSTLRRNPQCRFDHRAWQAASISGLHTTLTLEQALALLSAAAGEPVTIALAGRSFARGLRCPGCGKSQSAVHVVGRLAARLSLCRRCRREMLVSGLDLLAQLDASLPQHILSTPLSRMGVQAGDFLEVSGVHNPAFLCEMGGQSGKCCEDEKSRPGIPSENREVSHRPGCEHQPINEDPSAMR